jgi:gamma-glutamyltranspeptidase / glutathione hydrolase
VVVNRLQGYIFEIVEKIYISNQACRATFGGKRPGRPVCEGEVLAIPHMADTFEALAREGEDLFHKGDIARRLIAECRDGGGYLSERDLEGYQVALRKPLELDYAGARLFTNPPPSTGGILIAFALELLRGAGLAGLEFGSTKHLATLGRIMDLTNRARVESGLGQAGKTDDASLLDPRFLDTYRRQIMGRPAATRGTTHISVIDARGNAASMTLSNGEGSGTIIPGTGIMTNNMLGEEDINPLGFHRWPKDTRMCSMMAPSLMVRPGGQLVALGSGGSNRIRTAILQVVLNLLEFGMTAEGAVESPRIHFEDGLLSAEGGFDETNLDALAGTFPYLHRWGEKNLFFGGVHSVLFDPNQGTFSGVGDTRRGGAAVSVG